VVELPPELCIVVMSPMSAITLRSFMFIPSIMYRIQCMLLSMNLKMQLGPSMQQFDIPVLKVRFYCNFLIYAQYNVATKSACCALDVRT
jgi:endoribonuclease Dicer